MSAHAAPAWHRGPSASGLTIVGALAVGAVVLGLFGKDPLAAYRALVTQGLGTSAGIAGALNLMAPLLLMAASLLIAFTTGIWNIGVDGQFLVGAMLVGGVAPWLTGIPGLPAPLVTLVLCLVGLMAGGLWALGPALLKSRYGLNEIISTIMMNYAAVYLTSWLVKGPFKDPTVVPPQTPIIPAAYRLAAMPIAGGVHVGLLAGMAAVIVVHLMIRRTTLGFGMRVAGVSQRAARHAGMPVQRILVVAFALSGAMAGLAGAIDVLGVKGLFQGEWNPEYGFTAVALVFLARLHGVAVIPLAFLFAFLRIGGEMMSRFAGVPVYFVTVLEGLMLIFFAVTEYLNRRRGPLVELR